MKQSATRSRDLKVGPDFVTLAKAAALLAEGKPTDEQIAQSLGVSRRTLARWKHYPELTHLQNAFTMYYRRRMDEDREVRFDRELAQELKATGGELDQRRQRFRRS